jgi:hypothetical protein
MMKGALALHEDVLRNVGDIQNLSADSTSWSARTTLVYDVIKSQEAQQVSAIFLCYFIVLLALTP